MGFDCYTLLNSNFIILSFKHFTIDFELPYQVGNFDRQLDFRIIDHPWQIVTQQSVHLDFMQLIDLRLFGLFNSVNFVYLPFLINFVQLANIYRLLLVCRYHRILEMAKAMGLCQKFTSNFLLDRHHKDY